MVKRIPFLMGCIIIRTIVVCICLLFLITPVYAEKEAKVPPEVEASGDVAFNFIDVELPVLAKFVSDISGKNFIFDERLKGKITIIAPSKLNLDEAYMLFTSVLEFKGFTLVPSGVNAYKIVPSAEAKQKGIDVLTEGITGNEGYIVRLIQLKHISSEDALGFLTPVISRDGHISIFKPGNLLLVIDSPLNIEKILKIVSNIDRPSTAEAPDIVFLRHAPAEDIEKILNEGMKALVSRQMPGRAPSGPEAKAVADRRLNAVVLFGPKGDRDTMKGLIEMLDVPSPKDQGRINVYFLENADAEELAKVLEVFVKGVMGTEQKTVPGQPRAAAFESTGQIIITPDKATNSILIVASPSDYNNLVEVIRKLDRRRKQVYVEAMIVEATVDKLRDLGARWRVSATHNNEPILIGGVGVVDATSMQSVISGLAGFTIGGMGNFFNVPITTVDSEGNTTTTNLTIPGFAALFSLDEFRGAINVLSTPQILTSDNKEAEIVVGENVPFITKRESDPTRTVSVFSTIERKDVGISLRITPQITEGDYVKLDIYQEISSVKRESNTDLLISVGPTTTKRSTTTSIVVKDSQTVVIGGLMQETEEEATDKVPILGDIPILGWAFKSNTTKKKKTNLLVFLTPHIVRDAGALERITDKKRKEFSGIGDSAGTDGAVGGDDLQSGVGSQGAGGKDRKRMYVEGQVLVRFKDGVSSERAEEIVVGHGARIIKYMDGIHVFLIELRADETVEDAVEYFNSHWEVQYAEPNYRVRIQ